MALDINNIKPADMVHDWDLQWLLTLSGNKTITSYNFGDLIKLTRSEGLLYTAIDDGGTIPICVFKHTLKIPSIKCSIN